MKSTFGRIYWVNLEQIRSACVCSLFSKCSFMLRKTFCVCGHAKWAGCYKHEAHKKLGISLQRANAHGRGLECVFGPALDQGRTKALSFPPAAGPLLCQSPWPVQALTWLRSWPGCRSPPKLSSFFPRCCAWPGPIAFAGSALSWAQIAARLGRCARINSLRERIRIAE